MNDQAKRITRQELYEKVWKSTLKQVTEEFGINYAELVQVCETLNVPRPQHGHWQRLKLGRPVEVIPLPEADTAETLEAIIAPKERRKKGVATSPEGTGSNENTASTNPMVRREDVSMPGPESQPPENATPVRAL